LNKHRRGFFLMEAIFAAVMVGGSVVGICMLIQSGASRGQKVSERVAARSILYNLLEILSTMDISDLRRVCRPDERELLAWLVSAGLPRTEMENAEKLDLPARIDPSQIAGLKVQLDEAIPDRPGLVRLRVELTGCSGPEYHLVKLLRAEQSLNTTEGK
jgi:hypothetical protein